MDGEYANCPFAASWCVTVTADASGERFNVALNSSGSRFATRSGHEPWVERARLDVEAMRAAMLAELAEMPPATLDDPTTPDRIRRSRIVSMLERALDESAVRKGIVDATPAAVTPVEVKASFVKAGHDSLGDQIAQLAAKFKLPDEPLIKPYATGYLAAGLANTIPAGMKISNAYFPVSQYAYEKGAEFDIGEPWPPDKSTEDNAVAAFKALQALSKAAAHKSLAAELKAQYVPQAPPRFKPLAMKPHEVVEFFFNVVRPLHPNWTELVLGSTIAIAIQNRLFLDDWQRKVHKMKASGVAGDPLDHAYAAQPVGTPPTPPPHPSAIIRTRPLDYVPDDDQDTDEGRDDDGVCDE